MKYKSAIFILIVLFSISYFLFFLSVSAFVSTSTNFQIHSADIQSISGEGVSDSFKVRSAGGQSAAGLSQEIKKIYSGILYWLYGVPEGGTLTVDIVDAEGNSVPSPLVTMEPLTFSFSYQTANGVFGTTTEKIRINNTTAGSQWNLTIAAGGGATNLWNGVAGSYDFNDPTPEAVDDGSGEGKDTDNYGGQMSIDASIGTLGGTCSATGISMGGSASFKEMNPGQVINILLFTAGASADTGCYWDLTDVGISQTIPAEQPADDYNINMVLTVTAI